MRSDEVQDVEMQGVSKVEDRSGSLDYGIRPQGVQRLIFHNLHSKKGFTCRAAGCYLGRGGVEALLGAIPESSPRVEKNSVVPGSGADKTGTTAPAPSGDGPWWDIRRSWDQVDREGVA